MPPINLTIETKQFRGNIFEIVIVLFVILNLLGDFIGLYDVVLDFSSGNPYKDYYSNNGIRTILVGVLSARLLFLSMFFLLAFRGNEKKSAKAIYLTSALAIGFLQWYELYYGSTFYYGEVRDKQGLMFPILASFMFTLVIWKINFSKTENMDFIIKAILTGLINVGLYVLWNYVYETWKLSP